MDNVLHAAFIGCGSIARKKHLPLAAEDPRLHIAALYDKDRNAACECKNLFGHRDTMIAEDPSSIFASKDIDVVFVATPNNTHAVYAIGALTAKKHVICEKPMALNAGDAQKMLLAAKENRRLLHISYQNRYTNQALFVKRLFDGNFFPEVYYAKAYAIRRRAVPTWGATMDRSAQGGGPLIDIGSHALDLAMWLSNNFEPAYAVGATYDKIAKRGSEANYWGNWDPKKNGVEDCALGFVVMKNGMTLTVDATYALNTVTELEASVDLFGAAGGIQLREEDRVVMVQEMGGRMCLTENKMQESLRSLTPRERTMSASAREHQAFMGLLMEGRFQDPSAEQAYAVSCVVDGLYRSAQTRQPVFF